MNNFAVTSGGLGDIIERGGAAMATANSSLEQTLALGTAGNEILNNPERVGNGLKTLALRLRGSSVELENAGEEVDEFVTSTSKMQGLIKTLTGVDIMRSATEYKDVYEILDEIAKVYNSMTDINKASLTEAMFGKNQANLGTAILTNFQTARDVMADLTSGAARGSAAAEYEKWQQSLEAKIAKLSSTFERFSIAIFDDEVVGVAIDGLTGILSVASALSETISDIPSLAGLAGAALAAMLPKSSVLFFDAQDDQFHSVFTTFKRQREQMKQTLALDRDLMIEYLNLSRELNDEERAFEQNRLRAQMSDAARSETLAGGFDKAAMDAFIQRQKQGINGTYLWKKVWQGLKSVAASALSIGTNMIASAALAWALEQGLSALYDWTHATKVAIEESEALKDQWEASGKELENNKKILDQYGTKYATLSQGVSIDGSNLDLSTEEYNEFIDARDMLASTFPELIRGYDAEGNALLKLSGTAQDVTKALQDVYNEQVRNQRIAEQTDFLQTVGQTDYKKMYGERDIFGDFDGGVAKQIANANALIALLESENGLKILNETIQSYGVDRAGFFSGANIPDWDINGPDLSELFAAIGFEDSFNFYGALTKKVSTEGAEKIKQYAAEYVKLLTATLDMQGWQEEVFRVLEGAFDPLGDGRLSAMDESMQNIVRSIFTYLNDPNWYAGFGGNVNQFHAYLTDHLISPLQNLDTQSALKETFDLINGWYDSDLTRNDYIDNLIDQITTLKELGMGELADTLLSGILDDGFESKIAHAANALGYTIEQAQKLLTFSQLNWINRNVKSGESIEMDDVLSGMADEAEQASNAIDVLTESYTKFTEARTAAMTALASLSEKGYLTPEESKQVSDAGLGGAIKRTQYGSSYVDYETMRALDKALTQAEIDKQMEAIALKTQEAEAAYLALFEAQEEGNLAELVQQQNIIDQRAEEIEQINLYIDALEGSLSALNAFKQAASMGELGDNFRATKDAIDAISEGLETGRVGTNKFASAVELMFGEQALSDFRNGKISRSDLKKMTSSVGGYYDEDGNLNRMEAFDDFVDAGIGRYFQGKDGKRFAFDAGTTMADVQKALGGVSAEMATYFLDAINEYANGEGELLGPADYLASYEERIAAAEKVQSMAVEAGSVTINADKVEEPAETGDGQTAEPPASTTTKAETSSTEKTDQSEDSRVLVESAISALEAATKAYIEEKNISGATREDQLKVASGDADIKKVAAEQVEKTAQGLVESMSAAQTAFEKDFKQYSPFGIPTKATIGRFMADKQIKELLTQQVVTADTTPAEEANAELTEAIEEQVTTPIGTDASSAYQELDAFRTEASSLITIPATLSILNSPTGADIPNTFGAGGASPNSMAVAKVDGGVAYANGNTLLGELAPEIIVDRKTGTWSLAEYPQLRKLNAGDIVFNGEQTKAILSGKKTDFSKTVSGKSNVDGAKGNSYAFGIGGRANQVAVNDSTKKLDDEIFKSLAYKYAKSSASQLIAEHTGKKPKGGGGSGAEEAVKEVIDWIERALEVAKKATEDLIKEIAKKIGYVAKNKAVEKAIESTRQEIKKNEAGRDKYQEHLDKLQKEYGLSDDIVSKIQSGDIDIAEYDEETAEHIKEYQSWYEKLEQCNEAIEELKEQELELARQKLDNINDYYDNKIDRIEARLNKINSQMDKKEAYGQEVTEQDYADAIASTQEKIDQLKAEREAYQQEFDALVAAGVLEPDSDAWHEYIAALEEMDEAILGSEIDLAGLIEAMENIPLTNLQNALDRLNALQNQMEAFQSFHSAQGVDQDEETYVDLIRNGFDQINNLKEQNALLLEQQAGLDVNSTKWQEIQQQIEDNEASIWEIMAAQESWNDSITDLEIAKLQEQREELEKTNDELERKKEMEDALEDLEKARTQRTKLVYTEGK